MNANDFLEKVLDGYSDPITNDIVDRVFLRIENDTKLKKDYKTYVGGKQAHAKNAKISQAIKAKFDLEDVGRCYEPKSTLIKSYMMFKTKSI